MGRTTWDLATLQYHRWAGRAGWEYHRWAGRAGWEADSPASPSTGEADSGYVPTCHGGRRGPTGWPVKH
jgi:hypothetical protein